MVVLESKNMLTAGSNQYLQPEYMSPLATTLDSKKSPLALLAQTCSQIGADSSKPIPSSDKKKDDDKKEKTPSPVEPRRSPAFKPYESTTSKKPEEPPDDKPSGRSSGQGSGRPSSVSSTGGGSSSGLRDLDNGRKSIETTSSASTTPIIRSGLEVLAGHPKDVPLGTYRPPGLNPYLPPGYPGLETHPAFRGAHPALLPPGLIPGLSATLASPYSGAAAAALYSSAGLTGGSLPQSFFNSPYMSYTRVKTSGGGDTVLPVCRDPYCTGCPYSIQNNHLLQSGGTCPPSCTQCEQAKATLSTIPGLSSLPSSSLVPASSLLQTTSVGSLYSTSSPSLLTASAPRPYVCSWVSGDSFCGKRFATSEELLQHLRTHTSVTSADSSALSLLSSPLHAHAALLQSAHSALHRPGVPYPPPTLSPLTAARYHPYGKPLTTTSALTPTLPVLSAYAPLAASYPAGFSPYASLYPRPPL